jgi:hypothetical protein
MCPGVRRAGVVMSGWTVQLLIDCDIVVSARCSRVVCDNHEELNLNRLSDKFGPEASALHKDLAARMRCTKCGNDQVKPTYAPRPMVAAQQPRALALA